MKAQASVEFLLLLAILSVIFALSVNYYLSYSLRSDLFLQEEGYKSICSQVNEEIKSALYAGAYYKREFYLPDGVYNASMQNYEIKIGYSGGAVSCNTYVNNTQNLSIGKNTIIYNETGLYIQ